MTVGNLGALRQRDAVGLLAWSSIAQAGFLLAPAAALFATDGLDAPVQYLAVYVLANLVAFGALAVVVRIHRDEIVNGKFVAGLGTIALTLAVVMAINVMLGLAYYLRLVAVLVDKPNGEAYVSPSPPVSVRVAKATVILGASGLVALSVWPDLLLSNLP